MTNSKLFLERAERFTETCGDYETFKLIYTLARKEISVRESTWAALSWLYGDAVADELEVL